MMDLSVATFSLVVWSVLWMAATPTEQATTEYHVYGLVLTKDNTELQDVTVTMERGSEIKETTSKANGEYRISFSSGDPIDTLAFQKTTYHPNSIAHLSGRRGSHNVHVVLYPENHALTTLEAQQVLSTYERLYFSYLRRGLLEKLLPEYRDRVKNLQIESQVPQPLVERLSVIRTMYGGER